MHTHCACTHTLIPPLGGTVQRTLCPDVNLICRELSILYTETSKNQISRSHQRQVSNRGPLNSSRHRILHNSDRKIKNVISGLQTGNEQQNGSSEDRLTAPRRKLEEPARHLEAWYSGPPCLWCWPSTIPKLIFRTVPKSLANQMTFARFE